MGATVSGFGLTNKGQKGLDNFWFDIDQSQSIAYSEFDICDSQAVHSFVKDVKPDIVFHLAAMSLVADCEADPLNAFKVNVVGTANIYNAVGTYGVPKIVSATTDKVYLNDGSASEAFKENSTLWGYEAYSASKVGAELVNDFWVKRGLN